MEEIISRMENINIIINCLNDDDKKFFNEESAINIKNMENIVVSLENLIKNFNIPNDKMSMINLNNLKNKIIMKNIYPYYWTMHNILNNMPEDELNKIQDTNYNNL